MDNETIENEYTQALTETSDEESTTFLTKELDTLRSGVLQGTPYIYDTDRRDSFDYYEDDWTRRLKYALGIMYPGKEILTYPDKKGMNPVDLNVHESKRVYPIYGGFDIIIRKRRSLVMTCSEQASDDERMSHQRTNLTSGSTKIPQKIGELLAGLHFLLVSEVIRAKQKLKEKEIYSVEGILVDLWGQLSAHLLVELASVYVFKKLCIIKLT